LPRKKKDAATREAAAKLEKAQSRRRVRTPHPPTPAGLT